MSETAAGFLILGIGMLIVLGVVFGIASHGGGGGGATVERPHPPRGVHLPDPSFLPIVMSVAFALLGAGMAFRADGQLANPFLAIPGLLVFIVGIIAWVRAADHEWHDTERRSHDDGAAH